MIKVSISGGAFTFTTGWPWTAGLSPYRHKDVFNLRHEDGLWRFEMNGVEYFAKKVSPCLQGIHYFREY